MVLMVRGAVALLTVNQQQIRLHMDSWIKINDKTIFDRIILSVVELEFVD